MLYMTCFVLYLTLYLVQCKLKNEPCHSERNEVESKNLVFHSRLAGIASYVVLAEPTETLRQPGFAVLREQGDNSITKLN